MTIGVNAEGDLFIVFSYWSAILDIFLIGHCVIKKLDDIANFVGRGYTTTGPLLKSVLIYR